MCECPLRKSSSICESGLVSGTTRCGRRNCATLNVRPVRPEDESLYPPFLSRVSQDDLRLRFFAPVKEFGHAFIARFTQLDYARAVAFIAIDEATGEMIGVGRLHANSTYDTAEFAVLVRSDFKGHGLGWLLMRRVIDYAKEKGLRRVYGDVLVENTTMLQMCAELGFNEEDLGSGLRRVVLDLENTADAH